MNLEQRVDALEQQVALLLKGRPGRPLKPIVSNEPHVCGVDPERDSGTCLDANLWNRMKGCQGDACVQASTDYYRAYRAKKKEEARRER